MIEHCWKIIWNRSHGQVLAKKVEEIIKIEPNNKLIYYYSIRQNLCRPDVSTLQYHMYIPECIRLIFIDSIIFFLYEVQSFMLNLLDITIVYTSFI